VDDVGFGRLLRLSRIRRGWRQQDLADRTLVSRATVSRLECGHFAEMSIAGIRRVGSALDLRIEVHPRARALDLDRTVNARHAALAEHVIAWIGAMPGWVVRPEVSFQVYGERGVVDVVAWHAGAAALLLIELKTEVLDFGDLLGKIDRKHRLAEKIVESLDWRPAVVGSCLLIADSMTNRRRVADHASTMRAAFLHDGHDLARWLRKPVGELRALRFVSDVRPGHARSSFAAVTRVRTGQRP
jgi:transcriptional regulator with XRE-family HTH domain